MPNFSRMPNYDIRNDGIGPYCVFYCETCGREYRSQPDMVGTVTQDIGKQVASGLLRKVPLFGNAVANNVVGEDPRYSMKLTPAQIEKAWQQVQVNFRECPTCLRIVCLSDFDTQSGFCQEDSPRSNEISEARGEQTGAALKGLANAFGFGDVVKNVQQAAKSAQTAANQAAHCPNCGQDANGAKFCPNCGTPIESKPKITHCPNCGTDVKGAKFCPECGTKIG